MKINSKSKHGNLFDWTTAELYRHGLKTMIILTDDDTHCWLQLTHKRNQPERKEHHICITPQAFLVFNCLFSWKVNTNVHPTVCLETVAFHYNCTGLLEFFVVGVKISDSFFLYFSLFIFMLLLILLIGADKTPKVMNFYCMLCYHIHLNLNI